MYICKRHCDEYPTKNTTKYSVDKYNCITLHVHGVRNKVKYLFGFVLVHKMYTIPVEIECNDHKQQQNIVRSLSLECDLV